MARLILGGNTYIILKVLRGIAREKPVKVPMEDIAIQAGVCRQTVISHLRALEAMNYIERLEPRRGATYQYRILEKAHEALARTEYELHIS